MTVAVSNITNLKNVDTSTGNKLRWVESKRAWYGYDSSSTGTADDENIVLPTSGVGRWHKGEAKNPINGLVYTTYTGTQTINASSNTGLVITSTNGIVTVNLPSSPIAGDTIKIIHLSSTVSNVTRINRNGNAIRGSTSITGIEAFQTGTVIDLYYTTSARGWEYVTNLSVRDQSNTNQTFTYASDGDTNGFFHWLGRNSGTTSWVNPTQSNGGTGAKMRVIRGQGSATDNLTDRTTSEVLIAATDSYAGLTAYIFTDIDNNNRIFRPSRLAIRNSTSTTYTLRTFRFFGIKRENYPGNPTLINTSSAELLLKFRTMPSTLLLDLTNDTTMPTTASAWANYDIAATDFFSGFIFVMTGLTAGGNTDMYLGEMELYGDVRF